LSCSWCSWPPSSCGWCWPRDGALAADHDQRPTPQPSRTALRSSVSRRYAPSLGPTQTRDCRAPSPSLTYPAHRAIRRPAGAPNRRGGLMPTVPWSKPLWDPIRRAEQRRMPAEAQARQDNHPRRNRARGRPVRRALIAAYLMTLAGLAAIGWIDALRNGQREMRGRATQPRAGLFTGARIRPRPQAGPIGRPLFESLEDSRKFVWMIIGMIKRHRVPTRVARQADGPRRRTALAPGGPLGP
jgi:hypothetical protein